MTSAHTNGDLLTRHRSQRPSIFKYGDADCPGTTTPLCSADIGGQMPWKSRQTEGQCESFLLLQLSRRLGGVVQVEGLAGMVLSIRPNSGCLSRMTST